MDSYSKDKPKLETPKSPERGKDMQTSQTRTRDIRFLNILVEDT